MGMHVHKSLLDLAVCYKKPAVKIWLSMYTINSLSWVQVYFSIQGVTGIEYKLWEQAVAPAPTLLQPGVGACGGSGSCLGHAAVAGARAAFRAAIATATTVWPGRDPVDPVCAPCLKPELWWKVNGCRGFARDHKQWGSKETVCFGGGGQGRTQDSFPTAFPLAASLLLSLLQI